MDNIFNIFWDNIIQILTTVITAMVGYLGLKAKNMCEQYLFDKRKKDIIKETVKYVEQVGKNLTCEEKLKLAHDKSLKWLVEKKISISETELEILIESAVNCL